MTGTKFRAAPTVQAGPVISMKSVFAGVGFGLMATAASAYAQTPASDVAGAGVHVSETIYEPGYYARYSPRPALDMVQQTPGSVS